MEKIEMKLFDLEMKLLEFKLFLLEAAIKRGVDISNYKFLFTGGKNG